MNLYHKALMGAPSVGGLRCAVCGRYPAERHHIVFRSQGGADGPTVPLCGFGNASGCHGLAHAYKLHFRYDGCWRYIVMDKSTKYEQALKSDGWVPLLPR